MKFLLSVLASLTVLEASAQPLTLNDPVFSAPVTAIGPIITDSLTTYSNTAGAFTYTTASYTPTANALLLAFVFLEQNKTITNVSGNGMAWVLVNTVETSSQNVKLSIYRALSNAPSAGALTVGVNANSSSRGVIIYVQQFQNVVTTGTNGSGAVIQSIPLPLSADVNQAPINTNGFNTVVGATVGLNSTASGTAESGWVQALKYAQSPSLAINGFIAYATNSTDLSYVSGVTANAFSIALEIQAVKGSLYILPPSSISSLAFWLSVTNGVYQDAAKTVPCTADGDLVYTWDNAGNTALTADAIQATSALRPIYNVTGGFNGKPRLIFTSATNQMRLISGTFSQPYSMVVVAKCTNATTGFAVYLQTTNGGALLASTKASSFGILAYNGTLLQSSFGFTNGMASAAFNTTASYMFQNSFQINPTADVGAGNFLGAVDVGPLQGDIYEVMFFSKQLTRAEIAQLQKYANYMYGPFDFQ